MTFHSTIAIKSSIGAPKNLFIQDGQISNINQSNYYLFILKFKKKTSKLPSSQCSTVPNVDNRWSIVSFWTSIGTFFNWTRKPRLVQLCKTIRVGQWKQEAHQLVVGLGKSQRHSTLQSRQTFSQIQYVITGNLASNRDQIMHLYTSHTRCSNFCSVQYLIAFCRLPEAPRDVTFGRFVKLALVTLA